jgi:hypothetical protein
VLNKEESLCVMINEEDHLRMQALRPGLQLKQAWAAIEHFDSQLEKKLEYAFDSNLGYLTACPTNLGTGIRVSAMLHLPGLVLAEQINQIISAVNKLGLAVRGLYGEGTEALGNVFQVSNQMTLGESEPDIVERLNKVLAQIIEHEENARGTLLEKKPKTVMNQIGRASGRRCLVGGIGPVFDKQSVREVTPFHRHAHAERRRAYAGQRLDSVEDIALESREFGGLGSSHRSGPDPRDLDFFRLREARIHIAQSLKRSEHQAGGHDQHECERHLRNHKRIACAMGFAARRCAAHRTVPS